MLCESVRRLLLRLSTDFLKSEVHFKSTSFASSFEKEDMERPTRAKLIFQGMSGTEMAAAQITPETDVEH